MIYGFTFGAPLALLPLVMAESMGLKRFGSLYGLIGFFHTVGRDRTGDCRSRLRPTRQLFLRLRNLRRPADYRQRRSNGLRPAARGEATATPITARV
jgi:hypothetical protein